MFSLRKRTGSLKVITSAFQMITSADARFSFRNQVKMVNNIHGYNTRQASELIYYVPKFSKSISQNHILFRATKLWRELNKNFKSMGWINFKKSYKISLLENY